SSETAIQVSGLSSNVTQISAGSNNSCAIINGGVKCWGEATNGVLGASHNQTENASTPIDIAGLESGVKWVEVGDTHACALLDSGTVKCWGTNQEFALGTGGAETEMTLTPVSPAGLDNSVSF